MNEERLRACTVRLKAGGQSGTGFFVAPGTVLTCEHVVRNAGLHGTVVVGNDDHGKVLRLDPENDLALLKVATADSDLAPPDSRFKLDDPVFSYGYPKSGTDGDPISGKVIAEDGLGLIKFKDTLVEPGMSGAPLLNLRTGRVCGMIKSTLGAVGGYAVRGEVLQRFLLNPASSGDLFGGLPTHWRSQIEGFLTQYLGTPAHPAPFGGRDENLKELDEWIATPDTPPYALIAARSGVGKSALIAHWVDSLQRRQLPFDLIYQPISARWETNSASAVFQSLAFRLAAVFADPIPDSQDIEQLRGVILGYLEKANREKRQLLIVIDGLDEAAGWQADNRFFPPARQTSVRILVSARPLYGESAKEWLARLGWNITGIARSFDLDLLDQSGVADVLRYMGNPLAPLAGRLDVVGTLFRKSEGDPLVVGLYVEKLREYVTQPETFQVAELERMEPGLAGFFKYWLNDQVKLWGGERHIREPRVRIFMGLCSLAYGPLTREDLRNLARETFSRPGDVEATAEDLSRFLTTDARSHSYIFGHPRFGDYIRDELLDQEERRDFAKRFVAYGSYVIAELQQGRKEHAPTYIVRWQATHLADLRSPFGDYRPLLNYQWYRECEEVDGTPAGFLANLDKAWDAATGPAGVGMRVRVALIRSSLLTLGRNIPLEVFQRCVQGGILSTTLAEVIACQHDDGIKLCSYLATLANCVPAERTRLLRKALEAARQIGDENRRAAALGAVAWRLVGSDRELLREALEAARQIGNEVGRAQALSAVARRLEGGDRALLREALEAARQIGDENRRGAALSTVAARLQDSDRELLREALEAAHQIGDTYGRALALSAVAGRLEGSDREKELREALEAARQIGDEYSRAEALSAVAGRLESSDRELLREALDVARQIEDDHRRVEALSAVAAWLEDGDREEVMGEALEAARQIGDPDGRAAALSTVAARLEGSDREGVMGEALRAARQIEYEHLRSRALGAVAGRLEGSARELLREVLDAARKIGDSVGRAVALSAVAGRLEGSERERVLEEALEAARQTKNTDSRAMALSAVGERLEGSDRELLRGALDAARLIGDDNRRVSALSAAAGRLEGSDRQRAMGEALVAARQIGDQYGQVVALSAVAGQLKGSDRETVMREALEVARQIGDEHSRAEALSAVAGRLEGSNRERAMREALDVARQIASTDSRAMALSWVAGRLESSDRELLREALEAACQIDNEHYRAEALSAVAGRLDGRERELLQEALEAVRQIGNADRRAKVLSAMAGRLEGSDRERVVGEALEAARQGRSEYSRAIALSAVAGRLDGSDKEKVMREALEAARQIGNEYSRAIALSAVAERLEGSDREIVMREVLEAVRRIGNPHRQREALNAVAMRLEGSDRELLQEALDAARQIEDEHPRAQALSAVAGRLEGSDRELLREALGAARHIGNEHFRAEALIAVAERLPVSALPSLAKDFHSLVGQFHAVKFLNILVSNWPAYLAANTRSSADELAFWLDPLSRQSRPHFLRALEALMPALLHAGGKPAVLEAAEAISDTARWWP